MGTTATIAYPGSRRRQHGVQAITAILLLLSASMPVLAHQSPSDVVEALTQSIAADGENADLFVRRAEEYRLLRDYQAALSDANHALALKPDHVEALRCAAGLYALQGQFPAAAALAEDAAALTRNTPWHGAALITLATIQEQANARGAALKSVRGALAAAQTEVDWFLQESRLLAALARPEDRVDAMRAAISRNPSVVLEEELTDALIAAGHSDEALARVNSALAASSRQARWLIRRARIWKGLGEEERMRGDLTNALFELASRGSTNRMNPSLTLSRIEALVLLGEENEAAALVKDLAELGAGHIPLQQARELLANR